MNGLNTTAMSHDRLTKKEKGFSLGKGGTVREEAHLAHVARVVLPPSADLCLEQEALRIVSRLGCMVHASWFKV